MTLAVVLTHWGPAIPARRLAEHWAWNDVVYRAHGARVYVVADGPRDVPDYARVVPCREPLDPFRLSRTSNVGIRAALADGAAIVVKTDPDILWPSETFGLCASLGSGRGIAPTYRMAASRDAAASGPSGCPPWNATRGTLCLSSVTWEAIRGYDERMAGYGIEDGDACRRARGHVRIDRSPIIYHIAHASGSDQVKNRSDQWGRESGINPRRSRENSLLAARSPWNDPGWGLPKPPAVVTESGEHAK